MNKLLLLIAFIAWFNEQLMEQVVGRFVPKLGNWGVLLAFAIGLTEAVALKVNALPLVGIEANAYFGYFVTGAAVGGVSTVLHRLGITTSNLPPKGPDV